MVEKILILTRVGFWCMVEKTLSWPTRFFMWLHCCSMDKVLKVMGVVDKREFTLNIRREIHKDEFQTCEETVINMPEKNLDLQGVFCDNTD